MLLFSFIPHNTPVLKIFWEWGMSHKNSFLSIIAHIVADMKKNCNRFEKKSRKKSAKIKKFLDYP
jgi:hypothetical protein